MPRFEDDDFHPFLGSSYSTICRALCNRSSSSRLASMNACHDCCCKACTLACEVTQLVASQDLDVVRFHTSSRWHSGRDLLCITFDHVTIYLHTKHGGFLAILPAHRLRAIDTGPLPAGHGITGNTGSTYSWQFARNCLRQCLENHNCSGLQNVSKLPHRVLDLFADCASGISLHESEDQEGTYACLSHLWGASQPLRTTKSSLGAMKSGIMEASLPKTFLDAVTIDDHRDWQRESAKMADVYQNCVITISATGSSGADSGLFYNNPNVVDKELAAITKNPDHKGIFVLSNDAEACGRHGFDGYPQLMTRGWVLQERLLSPRLLHFKHELIFECREDRVCECLDSKISRWPPAIASKANGDELKLVTMSSEALCSSWHNIVSDYARLQLTYNSDVLPAISGLAQLYQRYLGGSYVAGMWAASLASCLTWHVADGHNWERRTSWVAPTFSWACNKIGHDAWASNLNSFILWAGDSVNTEYELLDLSQTLAGSDLTGQITQAHLILKGLLYPVILKQCNEKSSSYNLIATYEPLQRLAKRCYEHLYQDFNYTALDQAQHNRTLCTQAYCFLLCSEHATGHFSRNTTYLLILKKTSDREGTAGEFERIGMMRYWDKNGTMKPSWTDKLRNLAGGESGIVEEAIIRLV